MPHEKAVQLIIDGRGTHFDPDIVDAFVELQDEFFAIGERYADSEAALEEKARLIDLVQASR